MTNYTTLESAKKVKKETVFTHFINSDLEVIKNNADLKPSSYNNVLYIGKDGSYGDVF